MNIRDNLKNISNIFCSSRPITEQDRLVGREQQVFSLGKAIMTPCRHVVVYGARGVGKTSLIKAVVSSHCESESIKFIEYICTKSDTPETILYKLLNTFNLNIKDKKEKSSYKRTISAKARILVAEGDAQTTRENDEEVSHLIKQTLTPDYVATVFKGHEVVYCIDEFDRVDNKETVIFLSELMKAISDYNSGLKLVISGVADSFNELFLSHASVSRCLDSVDVPLLYHDDIEEIIEFGTSSLHLEFDGGLKKGIIFLSTGLPYFTHLLCEELSFNCFLHNTKSACLTDLFIILKGVLKKITGNAVNEYELMEVKLFNTEPYNAGWNNSTPTQVKRYVVHALSLCSITSAENIYACYLELCKQKESWIPDKYIFKSDADITIILEEIIMQSALIKESRGLYFFFKSVLQSIFTIEMCR